MNQEQKQYQQQLLKCKELQQKYTNNKKYFFLLPKISRSQHGGEDEKSNVV